MNVLDELTTAIDGICDADPARLADRETIQALHRQLERLDAATTRATSAFEAAGTWEADGARSAAAWVATRCRVPVTAARRRWPRRVHPRAQRASRATRRCWWSRPRA